MPAKVTPPTPADAWACLQLVHTTPSALLSSQLAENYIEVFYLQRALCVYPPADPIPDLGSVPLIGDDARSPSCRNFWNPPKAYICVRHPRNALVSFLFLSSVPLLPRAVVKCFTAQSSPSLLPSTESSSL
jgi:hypothetical protein